MRGGVRTVQSLSLGIPSLKIGAIGCADSTALQDKILHQSMLWMMSMSVSLPLCHSSCT